MAFTTGYLGDPQQIGAGERQGNTNHILSAERGKWQNGLFVGRFAQVLNGDEIANMDGTVTPVIAGVVLRNPANAIEDADTFDTGLWSHIEYLRMGFVTVCVKDGETAPDLFGDVQASNAGDADDGKAVATGGVDANAEFISDLGNNVWFVRLK